MTIPAQAIQAAARAIFLTDYAHMGPESWEAARLDGNSDRPDAYRKAEAALQAALPHLRAEIANDIRADWRLVGPLMAGQPQSAVIEFAARTAEKGPTK